MKTLIKIFNECSFKFKLKCIWLMLLILISGIMQLIAELLYEAAENIEEHSEKLGEEIYEHRKKVNK